MRQYYWTFSVHSPVHRLYKIDYEIPKVTHGGRRVFKCLMSRWRNEWKKHVNQKISKLFQRTYATTFGSDSYIRQCHTHCLRSLNHEVLYTSTSYELKWGVLDLSHFLKLHLKCRLMSEIGVFKMTKFLKI